MEEALNLSSDRLLDDDDDDDDVDVLTLYGTYFNPSEYEYHVPVLHSDCTLGGNINFHYKRTRISENNQKLF